MYNDLTLRDGSHAIAHQLTEEMIIEHCKFCEDAGIDTLEIGHGNGLGDKYFKIFRYSNRVSRS